jgi:hypothetical protein
VSQSSEFCHHNPLCCFSTSVYCCKRIFRYRLSLENFGYTVVLFFLGITARSGLQPPSQYAPFRMFILRFRENNSFLVWVFSPTPNPQPGGPGLHIYIPLVTGWPSYTPRHRIPILVAFYDMHGLQWDYSFPRSPHGDRRIITTNNFVPAFPVGWYALSTVCLLLKHSLATKISFKRLYQATNKHFD